MDSTSNSTLLGLLLAATLAITIAIAFIVIPSEAYGTKFYLNLGFIIFAELVVFIWPIRMSSQPARQAGFIFGLGFSSVLWLYLAGVLAIAAISLLDIGYKTPLVLHLLWVLFLLFSVVTWKMGSQHVTSVIAERKISRQSMMDVRQLGQSIQVKVSGIASKEIKKSIDALVEDIIYARTNSNERSDSIESDIKQAIGELKFALDAAIGDGVMGGENEKNILKKISNIRSLISEREALLKINS